MTSLATRRSRLLGSSAITSWLKYGASRTSTCRSLHQSPASRAVPAPTSDSPETSSAARSSKRKYALRGQPDVTDGHRMPSQRPYGMAMHLKQVFDTGKLQEAVQMVVDSPLSSQNTVVWNMLIQKALQEDKFNQAFTLYNDMKKRGFKPSVYTYGIMFSGFLKTTGKTPLMHERIDGIWNQYQSWLSTLKQRPDIVRETTNYVAPYVPYLEIIGERYNRRLVTAILDGMDAEGPFAPDRVVYTTALMQLARLDLASSNQPQRDVSPPAPTGLTTEAITKRMKEAGVIDSQALCAIIYGALNSEDSQQMEIAYQIVHDLVGDLASEQPFVKSQVEVNYYLVDHILELCYAMGKYDEALHIFETAPADVRTRSHLNHALAALGALAKNEHLKRIEKKMDSSILSLPPSSQFSTMPRVLPFGQRAIAMLEQALLGAYGGHKLDVVPDHRSFYHALNIARHSRDWDGAMEVIKLMTGLSPEDFTSSAKVAKAKSTKDSSTQIELGPKGLGYIGLLATESGKTTHMRMALHFFERDAVKIYGRDWLQRTIPEHVADPLYKLARVVQGLLINLLKRPCAEDDRLRYKKMLEAVRMVKQGYKTARTRRNAQEKRGRPVDRRVVQERDWR